MADHLIASILGSLIGLPIGFGLAHTLSIPWPIPAGATIIIANILYFIGFESKDGTTPAKERMDLKIVQKETLEPITPKAALIRNVFRILDFSTFYLTGIGTAFASPFSQRLGDRIAGSVVVAEQDGTTDKLTPDQPDLQLRFVGWLIAVIGILPLVGIIITII